MSDLARQLLLCDSHPEDRALWEHLDRDLKRQGYTGPMADFIAHRVKQFGWDEELQKRIARAVEAWAPLVSQGFVLFTRGQFYRYGKVLHVGRIRIGGRWSREEYPEGWQRADLSGICDAYSSGVAYLSQGGFAWTDRKTPFRGHEHPPCKACLHRLSARRAWFWRDSTKAPTSKQISHLWELRKDL